MQDVNQKPSGWTFLTNHYYVLACLYEDSELTARELSLRIGITERSVQRVIGEMQQAGALEVRKEGRHNVYEIHLDYPLRHPLKAHLTLGCLLKALK